MKSVTLVFPGQGSQYIGMGNAPHFKEWFQKANNKLGFDLEKICLEGPIENLTLTKNTQPAIVTHSVALFFKLKNILEKKNIKIDRVLGHSVGEYSALVAAGVFKFEDAVFAVHNRGQFMQEAVEVGTGKMIAVLRAPENLVVDVCKKVSKTGHEVMPANFNDPSQIVISGHALACDEAAKILQENTEHRIRCVELNVSAPFHCSLMEPAAQKLKNILNNIEFQQLAVPYIANIDALEYAQTTKTEVIRDNLIKQVCGSVLWTQSFKNIKPNSLIIEVGPGKILNGLIKRINKDLNVLSLDSEKAFDELEQLLDESNLSRFRK